MTTSILRAVALVTVAAGALATPAAMASPAASGSKVMVYTNADSHTSVRLPVHAKFEVTLKTSTDGGYRWSFSQRSNKKVVQLLNKVVHVKAGQVGGYTHTVFTFKTVGVGATREKLFEHQGKSTQNEKHFELTQVVHK